MLLPAAVNFVRKAMPLVLSGVEIAAFTRGKPEGLVSPVIYILFALSRSIPLAFPIDPRWAQLSNVVPDADNLA